MARAPHIPLILSLLGPGIAAAHGAFPETREVSFRQEDDALPVVLSTFGLLIPQSARDWSWVCEELAGTAALTSLVALPSGRTLVGSGVGPYASDDLCTWSRLTGDVAQTDVTQLEISPADGALWLGSASASHLGGMWRSTDDGRTFSPWWVETFGPTVEVTGFALGADGAPAFVTGSEAGAPAYWLRDGAAWTRTDPGTELGDQLVALGLSWGGVPPAFAAFRTGLGDALVAIDARGELSVRVDRDTVGDFLRAYAVGPTESEVYVGGTKVGLLRSTDGGATFTGPVEPPAASCLTVRGDRILQCTDNYQDAAALIRHGGDPTEAEVILRFGDVHQPLDCPDGSTVAVVCEPLWALTSAVGLNQVEVTPTATAGEPASPGPDGTPSDGGLSDACEGCSGEGTIGAGLWLGILGLARRRRR